MKKLAKMIPGHTELATELNALHGSRFLPVKYSGRGCIVSQDAGFRYSTAFMYPIFQGRLATSENPSQEYFLGEIIL